MSWAVKIAGKKSDVVSALRTYHERPNTYPDSQRDAVLGLAADQIEQSGETWGGGVIVDGSGHQGSNFNVKIEFCELAVPVVSADTVIESPAPTESGTSAAPAAS